ncbi:hypothetical protein A1Q1_03201 [Trichosporon asahii var. asahii CBS 2479]|uniref:Hydrophobin n=1 Tax=Trichosporon asahii var. asahii (strain ATCC 90039 / CBS 2479 / JCM 2466 / KCTC 7840 / NBRC 103889/ NCYC 2677 / UAMH 7654) TaxID=1186058 RepID=J4UAS3_TRIAS|nr:hypothetical protein A1Q1_03201 [Trichosporon asahii var. asahii CBS 2479]EJT47895.1 hypothetical protein A1Q1_03201 [Trichosporon asahii var. asahii CBS 2479]
MSMRLTSLRQSALSALPTLTGLTGLATLALLALAHPASASSLYHETCTGACNGAYAHCCAHVTGVIGESRLPVAWSWGPTWTLSPASSYGLFSTTVSGYHPLSLPFG